MMVGNIPLTYTGVTTHLLLAYSTNSMLVIGQKNPVFIFTDHKKHTQSAYFDWHSYLTFNHFFNGMSSTDNFKATTVTFSSCLNVNSFGV